MSATAGRYRRPLSPIERAWLVASELYPPFVNQLVLEGVGQLDPRAWTSAVAVAAAANPGVRIVLRGATCGARWEEGGPVPPVREVDGSRWAGASADGAAFLAEPLDPVRGPIAEVLLVRGNPARVVVRTLHAAMDGGGTLAWTSELFRVLRGEPPLGMPDTVIDLDLARGRSGGAGLPPPDALPPTGPPSGPAGGVSWRRVRVATGGRHLIGRVAHALARSAWSHREGVVRFQVPADLRRQHPSVRSTANLTGFIHVEVGRGDRPEDLAARVVAARDAAEHAAHVRSVAWLRHVPRWVLRAGSRRAAIRQDAAGLYGASGVITNLGRVELADWSGGGFEPSGCFFVPPGTATTCVFLSLIGHAAGVDLTLAVPDHLGSGGRLEALTDRVVTGL